MTTPAAPRRLRLVSHQSDDYSLANVLLADDAAVLETPAQISAAMSLYFQWEEQRECILLPSQPGASGPACELDYDRDEASPSELRVSLRLAAGATRPVYEQGGAVGVRFVVFRTCYEFKTEILAVSDDADDGWDLILGVPDRLFVRNGRRLPRLLLDDEARQALGSVQWTTSEREPTPPLFLLEIGLTSLRVQASTALPVDGVKAGFVAIGDVHIRAEIVRRTDDWAVLSLKFDDNLQFGAYFDLYRKLAYPALRSRYDYPLEAGHELYTQANYFGKYDGEKSVAEHDELLATWSATKGAFHEAIADYFVVDEQARPTGTSGLAHSHFHDDVPVWSFHQLCALKRPDLIEESGSLYTWRAEYLAARPGPLDVVVWFHSKSRWLERLYVKHSQMSQRGTKIYAVADRWCTYPASKKTPVELSRIAIGETERYASRMTKVWAAVGPRFLNANGALNLVASLTERPNPDEIAEMAGQLATAMGKDELTVLVTLPFDYPMDTLPGVPQLSDRVCVFPKSDLVAFIASVEHSIAVTKRKFDDGSVA